MVTLGTGRGDPGVAVSFPFCEGEAGGMTVSCVSSTLGAGESASEVVLTDACRRLGVFSSTVVISGIVERRFGDSESLVLATFSEGTLFGGVGRRGSVDDEEEELMGRAAYAVIPSAGRMGESSSGSIAATIGDAGSNSELCRKVLGGEGGLCTGTLATRFEARICGSLGTIGVGVVSVSRADESGVTVRRLEAVAKVDIVLEALGRRRSLSRLE
jgi:hypothetical protein